MGNVILTKQIKVKVPKIPNYIEVNGKMQNLTLFKDSELKLISEQWYRDLSNKRMHQLRKAKKR